MTISIIDHADAHTVYHAETFTLSSGHVLTVEHDDTAESPNEWGNGTAYIYTTSSRGWTDAAGCELSEVFYRVYSEDYDSELALTVTRRYARAYMGMTAAQADAQITTYSARGYSQSDWWDILSITADGDAAAHARSWEQWARGDVYAVTDETTGDALGGIYADSAEDAALAYANEYA